MFATKKTTVVTATALSLCVALFASQFSAKSDACDDQIHQQSIQEYDKCVTAQQNSPSWSEWLIELKGNQFHYLDLMELIYRSADDSRPSNANPLSK